MSSATHTTLAGQLNALTVEGRVDGTTAVLTPRGNLVHGCADTLSRALAPLPEDIDRVELDLRVHRAPVRLRHDLPLYLGPGQVGRDRPVVRPGLG